MSWTFEELRSGLVWCNLLNTRCLADNLNQCLPSPWIREGLL